MPRPGRRAVCLRLLASVTLWACLENVALAQGTDPPRDEGAEALKRRLDEQERRLDEQKRELEEQQKLLKEQASKVDRQAREIDVLRGRVDESRGVAGVSSRAVADGTAAPRETGAGAPRLTAVDGADAGSRGVDEEALPSSIRRRRGPRPIVQSGPLNTETAPPATSGQPLNDAFHWSYQNGFFVAGKILGEEYMLRFMGRLQLDYRFFPTGQENAPDDQFLVRRARFGVLGTFGPFRYRFELAPLRSDTPNSQLPITHFWLIYEQFPEVSPLFGHYKTPFTYENGFMSSNWIDFIERPMVIGSGDGVAPHYNPGAEVLGEVGEGVFQYWLSAQSAQDTGDAATGDPLVAGRIESDFHGATLGGDAYGKRLLGNTQNSFQGLTAGKFSWFGPVKVHGWTYAWSVDASLYAGPVWARAEYVWAEQERNGLAPNGQDEPSLLVRGGAVTTGWHFWGPPPGSPRPRAPVDGWEIFGNYIKRRNASDVGMELVFRTQYMDVANVPGSLPFRDFFFGSSGSSTRAAPNDPNAAQAARVFSLDWGLNFDPIEGVRFMADWSHYWMEEESRREANQRRQADELLFRAQVAF